MASTVGAWLIFVCGLGQAEAPPAVPAKPTADQIQQAVERLGADQFQVREDATRFLWRAGHDAEAALQRAAKSPDLEVRRRAKTILENIELGLEPGMPVEVIRLAKECRIGSPEERSESFRLLLEQAPLLTPLHVAISEADETIRHKWLGQVFGTRRFWDDVKKPEQFAAIRKLAERQLPPKDRVLTGYLFTAPWSQTHIVAQGLTPRLLKLAQEETNDPLRLRELLQVFDPRLMKQLLEQKLFDDFLKLISTEKHAKNRAALHRTFVQNYAVGEYLRTTQRLSMYLDLIRDEEDPAGRVELLSMLFNNSSAATHLLSKDRGAAISGLIAEIPNPVERGTLTGRLFSLTEMIKQLDDAGELNRVVEFLQNPGSPAGRRDCLRGLIFNVGTLDRFLARGHYRALRQAVLDEPDVTERFGLLGEFLAVALRSRTADSKEPLDDLIEVLKGPPTKGRWSLLVNIYRDGQVVGHLFRAGHAETLKTAVETIPEPSHRAALLAKLKYRSSALDQLLKGNQFEAAMTFLRDESNPAERNEFLGGSFVRSAGFGKLVDAGFADELHRLIAADTDQFRRSRALGYFFSNRNVLTQLDTQKQLDKLWTFLEETKDHGRVDCLTNLFHPNGTVDLLIKLGHFERLLKIAQQLEPDDRANVLAALLIRPESIDLLLASGRIELLFDHLKNGVGWQPRQSFVSSIMSDSRAKLLANGHFQELFDLIGMDPNEKTRANYRAGFLLSKPVLAYWKTQKQPERSFTIIAELTPTEREAYLKRMVSDAEIQNLLFDAGYGPKFLKQVQDEPNEALRTELLVALFSNHRMLEQLTKRHQLAVAWTFVRGDLPAANQRSILGAMFNDTRVIAELIDQGHLDELQKMASGNPDPAARDNLLGQFYGSAAIMANLAKRGELGKVLKYLQESEPSARNKCVRIICNAPQSLSLMLASGHVDLLLELAAADSDAAIRGGLLSNLYSDVRVMKFLAAKNRHHVVFDYLQQEPLPSHTLSCATRLARNSDTVPGFLSDERFDELSKLIAAAPKDGIAMLYKQEWFSARPVLQRLAERRQLNQVIEFLAAMPENQRSAHLNKYHKDDRTMAVLIEQAQFEPWRALIANEPATLESSTPRRFAPIGLPPAAQVAA